MAAVLAMAVAHPAAAAPPPNDTSDGATLITGLPFTDDIDTSEATADEVELDAIAPLHGVPAVERAVWYVAHVSIDAALVRTDVTASDYLSRSRCVRRRLSIVHPVLAPRIPGEHPRVRTAARVVPGRWPIIDCDTPAP